MSGFNFGGSSTGSGGGFSFGATPAAAPATTTATAPAFSFGGGAPAPAVAAPATSGGSLASFGGGTGSSFPAPNMFSGSSLGAAPTTESAPKPTFSFGGAAPAPASNTSAPAPGGFSFGATPAAQPASITTASSTISSFGASATPAVGGLFGGATSTPAPSTFGAPSAAPAGGGLSLGGSAFSGGMFGAPKAAATTPATIPAPATTTASTLGGFTFNKSTTDAPTPSSFTSLGSSAAKIQASSAPAPIAAAPVTTSAPISSFSVIPQNSTDSKSKPSLFGATAEVPKVVAKPAETSDISWSDLESKINRWNTDIEQQVSVFIKQATQVNAWSGLLLANGEKISDLCSDLERVKMQQNDLDNELDRVASQQAELEAILLPLEEASSRSKSSSMHNVDTERERTYNLAGSVDAQIKSLAAELREVIERINSQQGDGGNGNLSHVTQILSSHTDALQWVEEQSASLQRRLEQVTRAVDTRAAIDQRNF